VWMRPVYYAGTDPQRWAARSTPYRGHKANNTDKASHREGWVCARDRKPVFAFGIILMQANYALMCTVLRIRGVYPGSPIRLFSIQDLNFFHPGSRFASKNLSLTPKMVSKL
jgi:hypothetical protein